MPLLESLREDVRFAFRTLRKSPSFAAVAVVTLALSIGANAVVFGALNALILRPLNVPDSQSLYGIERGRDHLATQSYPDYLDLRARTRTFDGLAAYNIGEAGLNTGAQSSRVWLLETSGNYFDVLRLRPYIGRFFHDADEHGPNSAPYVVLTYAYWHTHFHDDAGVVGHAVELDKHPYTILGVAPPGFHGTILFFSPDVILPIVNASQIEGVDLLNKRGTRWIFMVLGHLKPGVTSAQAVADLNSIGSYLDQTYPKDDGGSTFVLARPALYGDYLGRPVRAFLTALMLLAALILLAACANLGSLFAARAADRSRDVALRLALGSSRNRILRQLFTEAVLISLAGGMVGLWGSILLLHLLGAWNPLPQYPIQLPLNPDVHVYVVALLLAVASGFLFGAIPVKQILRTHPYELVKAGAGGVVGRRLTVRDALLVLQIAACAVLVTASIVAVRGLVRSLHSDFGFKPREALLVDVNLTMAGYSGDHVLPMQRRMLDALGTIPGVQSVGLIDQPPLHEGWNGSSIYRDNTTDLKPANAVADALVYRISPTYLDAAGTALLAGRQLSWHDDKNGPNVAVVNREFARDVFGSVTAALGGHYKYPDGQRIEVVGIVEDGKYKNLTESPQPASFLPIVQSPANEVWLVLRGTGDPARFAPAADAILRNLDPGLPFYIETWNRKLDSALFATRMATLSLGVLGLMGAMLAMTGIFGMAAYSVSKRLRELGIRIALGAQPREVLQAALGRAFKSLALGSVAGLFLGLLAAQVLSAIVYQASPRDPVVMTGAVVSMLLLGLLATWIPARRALSVQPSALLRGE